MQAALELHQPGPMRRPDQLENTQNRVALLGFDIDQRSFPAHSVASLPDDAEGSSWAAFWERNQRRSRSSWRRIGAAPGVGGGGRAGAGGAAV